MLPFQPASVLLVTSARAFLSARFPPDAKPTSTQAMMDGLLDSAYHDVIAGVRIDWYLRHRVLRPTPSYQHNKALDCHLQRAAPCHTALLPLKLLPRQFARAGWLRSSLEMGFDLIKLDPNAEIIGISIRALDVAQLIPVSLVVDRS